MADQGIPVANPFGLLRRILRACGAIISKARALQEPERRRLIESLQQICSNCRSAYEKFLADLAVLEGSYRSPQRLVREARKLSSRPEYRQTFKPDKLCGDVDVLLTRLRSWLDPLGYVIEVTRIKTLQEQLRLFRNYDQAFYQAFDAYALELSRAAIELEAALAEGRPRERLVAKIKSRTARIKTEVSTTLQQVYNTFKAVRI